MKHRLPLVFVFSILLSYCAPATQPPAPTSTSTITPSPTATATTTITFTPTPAPPDIVLQIQAEKVPGITVDSDSVMISDAVGDLIADIFFETVDTRIQRDEISGAYIVKQNDAAIAVFDPTIKTERWGEGKRWIERSEAVKFDPGPYTPVAPGEWDYSYVPERYVYVEGLAELNEALTLGKKFAPRFPAGVEGIDPEVANEKYYLDIQIRDPLGFRSDLSQNPLMYYNSIMYKAGNDHYVAILQEAVLNNDGSVGVISFAHGDNNPDEALYRSMGTRQNGDGTSYGNFLLPVLNIDRRLHILPGKAREDNWIRLGLLDPSKKNFDPEVIKAVELWLTTGILPDTIKGVPTERILFGAYAYNILEGHY